ncbi:MAG: IS200/IS605 family transposase [Acidobacteria bacterium]|nr:IS200/IS605 family transposase [Acidobacteriota bacterium]
MANTYSSLFYHAVFSTKLRQGWIAPSIEDRVWRNIGGIARGIDCTAVAVGGIEDHLHALLMVPPKYAPSEVVMKLNANSSRFIHEEFGNLGSFGWQDGFGIFSVSKSAVPEVIEYIRNQRIHHAKMSFEEEYRELLRLHDVDPRDGLYIFG